jgi:hypothetical protein
LFASAARNASTVVHICMNYFTLRRRQDLPDWLESATGKLISLIS